MNGADLTERDVCWLVRTEWAATAEDVLWRRSKLGLRLSPHEQASLALWFAHVFPQAAAQHAPSD